MKIIKLLFFLLLLSCKTEKKIDKVKVEIILEKTDTAFYFPFRNHKEIEFFKDYEKQRGSIIDDNIGLLILKKGNQNYILLNKFIRKNNPLKYKILDTVNIGKIEKNQYLAIYNCFVNNKQDKRLIALVEDNYEENLNKPFIRDILKSWIVDTENYKININKDIKSIKCENEGYGL
ncbi:MAG: hypothetical protein AB8B78_07230 [Polaribacter sp.]